MTGDVIDATSPPSVDCLGTQTLLLFEGLPVASRSIGVKATAVAVVVEGVASTLLTGEMSWALGNEGPGDGAQEIPASDAPRLNWSQTEVLGAEPAALGNLGERPVGCSPTYRPFAEPAAIGQMADGLEPRQASPPREESSPTNRQVAEPAAMCQVVQSPQAGKEPQTYWSEFSLSSTLPVYLAEASAQGECVDDGMVDANAFNFEKGAAALWSSDGANVMCSFLKEISVLVPPPTNASTAKPKARGGARARATKELAEGNGFVAKHLSLAHRAYSTGRLHISGKFSTSADASFASTGWHGRPPSVKCRKEIYSLWKSGEIMKILADKFYTVRYDM